jgi:hypothetical protein
MCLANTSCSVCHTVSTNRHAHSAGICNEKALSIGLPTGEDAAGISVTRKTKKGSFKTFNHKGKGAKRVVAAVGKDVSSYRQDLAREAMHVASVAHAASRRRASSSDDE